MGKTVLWIGSICFFVGCNLLTGTSDFTEGECHPACESAWLANGECNAACNIESCNWDAGDCSRGGDADTDADSDADISGETCAEGCSVAWVGDGSCDDVCYNAACSWDNNDCGAECAPGCPASYINDNYCDDVCFSSACNFDGDDCMEWFICNRTESPVDPELFCDGADDCENGQDELFSFCELTGDFITCADWTQSIPLGAVCDGVADCDDNSDEINCASEGCTASQFPCTNGECVNVDIVLDSTNDCTDGSDEAVTMAWFVCANGSQSLANTSVCNGVIDCTDASDEWLIYCEYPDSLFFTCSDFSRSIPAAYMCDGFDDCVDGSDEDVTDTCGPTE